MRAVTCRLAAVLLALMLSPATHAGQGSGDSAGAAAAADGLVLPHPAAPFTGRIGRTVRESIPAFPALRRAPEGAPNVLLVLTDDVGFGATSTFGGPVPTPTLDRLAANGLRYNRFHTTGMCSPTRAALLTGRNHHAVGTGTVTDFATGFPGYNSIIPRSAATVAEILRQNGYGTAFFGKHHNVPRWMHAPAGPFDHWPTGLGFDYFYGFIGAETNQFTPQLYRGTTPVDAPADVLLDRALADDVIRWLHNFDAADPDKPFFIYLAPGSAHEPHQAPREWIERFRGQFDAGWDVLRARIVERQKAMGLVPRDAGVTPRPEGIPAWSELTERQRQINARMMEAFAAMLAYQDDQLGRIVDELERMGKLDNTLILFIVGDNGAAAEAGVHGAINAMAVFANGIVESEEWLHDIRDEMGGPMTRQNYGFGWAWAMNAPFPLFKQYASHLGGTRNGLVISWPARIKSRGIRPQFHHVIDIMPTILEAASIPVPTSVNGVEQQPVNGVSMVYTFADPDAPDRRRTQYFEMMGNRAIYHEGWMASTTPRRLPWRPAPTPVMVDPDEDYEWELYDLRNDFAQSRNVATEHPEKLEQLVALWWREARKNRVLPLDDSLTMNRLHAAVEANRRPRDRYVYWGKDVSVPVDMAPPLLNRSFMLEASLVLPESGGNGVVAAAGGRFGGWSLFLQEGRPVFLYSASIQPEYRFRVASDTALAPGPAKLRLIFDYDGGGMNRGALVRLEVDGRELARGRVEHTISTYPEMTDTFDVGKDTGTPVADGEYRGTGRFDGDILRLDVVLQ